MNRIRGEGGRFHSGSVKKRRLVTMVISKFYFTSACFREEMERQRQQQSQQRTIGVSFNNLEIPSSIIIEVA